MTYHRSPEGRQRQQAYNAKYYLLNMQEIKRQVSEYRATHVDWKSEYDRRYGQVWRTNNKGKVVAATRRRQKAVLQATPSWANPDRIEHVYVQCALLTETTDTPHEVDHIIPLQGKTVCDLHCEANLQILTAVENRQKWNKWSEK